MAEDPPKAGGKEVEVKDNGAVVATGDGSGSSTSDYDSWGWKEIMARITGSAAIGAEERAELGTSGASDPQTLWDAALSFRMVKEILASTGRSIAEQAKALGGEGGPWQGEASKAFMGLMDEFSKSFTAHATQIDGGRSRLSPVPEQLWAAGNYLAWAIKTVHDIDQFYAREAQRIAAIKGEDVIIESDKGNLVHISKFPEIVKLLDRDMRQVLKTLAAEYEKQAYDTTLTTIPKPDPLGGGPDSKPPKIKVPPPPEIKIPPPPKVKIPPPAKIEVPPPPKSEIPPPPKGKVPEVKTPEIPEVKAPKIPEVKSPEIPEVRTPEIPGPNSGGLSGGPGNFSATPPPGKFDPGSLGGPGSGSASGKIPEPNAFVPGTGPGSGGLPGAGGTPSPNSFKPGDFVASQIPGGKPGGGNVPQPPGLKPGDFTPGEFTPGNGPGGGGLPGGNGAVPPPGSFVGSKPPASGRGGGNTPVPNVPKPGEFKPGEFKPGDFKPSEFPGGKTPPGGKVAPPGEFKPGELKPGELKPGELKPGDFKPGEFPGAKVPPGGQGAPPADFKPGEFKPGEFKPGEFKPGDFKPGEFKPGEVPNPNDWSAGKGSGASNDDRNGLGGGGMPMMPPGAPGAGTGGGSGAAERPDASGLIGGEVKPWEGSKAPGLGDPHGNVPQLPLKPEDWASSQHNTPSLPGAGMPGGGGMPMMPPGAPGAGTGGGSGAAERPDAAGLIGGEVKPWEGVDAPGVGEPQAIGQVGGTPEDWASSQHNTPSLPGAGMPGGGGMPMMPPGAPGAGTGGGSGAAERPDAAGLIGGEVEPWEGVDAPGVGEPQAIGQVGGTPEDWASSQRNASELPGGGMVSGGMPGAGIPGGMPMMPPGAPGAGTGGGSGAAERPDAAGLIGGEVEPWEGVELPGVGDPDTPGQEKSAPEQWSEASPNAGSPMLPPMPMAPGQGGAASGTGAAERSDASGLVDGEPAPWEHASAVPTGDPGGAETPRARPEPWTQDGSGPQVPVPEVAPEVPAAQAPAPQALSPQVPVAPVALPAPVTPAAPPAAAVPQAPAASAPSAPLVSPAVPATPATQTAPATPASPAGPGEKRREDALIGVPLPIADIPSAAHPAAPLATTFDDDRVALVCVGGDEDFSAWDAGASGGLPWLPTAAALRDDPEGAPEKPDYTQRDSTAWGHSAGREGAVRLQAETAARPIEMSAYLPRFDPHVSELGCAGLDAPEHEEPEQADEEQDEEDERTSADLLRQDTGVWADGGRTKAAPGVIE
ncbi:WXG100 family type VII secretion target [Lentzea sp. HUAS12]|uniref:WXG100 family type VII secretion target n=1 Tax=Lentzea sp. HUAS12 TaxID=2951806 RepID=UPI00209E4FEF|nr:hypothetical protein [Lentzea sp. HUAS12]USX55507.1 hypothetical protein ND450_15820 [Lentzea sp. HUAS12]